MAKFMVLKKGYRVFPLRSKVLQTLLLDPSLMWNGVQQQGTVEKYFGFMSSTKKNKNRL